MKRIRYPRPLRSLRVSLLAFSVLILAQVAFSQVAPGGPFTTTVPGSILDQFRNQRLVWTTNVWVYANNLFGLLAVIEFAWSAAVMLLEKSDLQSWTSALVRKLMWIGAFYALLLNGRLWLPAIIDSFTQVGAGAAGLSKPLAPSDVFIQGIQIAAALMDAASTSAFFTNPGTSLALGFSALLIVISYIIITLNFIVTMVETYLLLSVGFIFLGFGGSRWTAPYVERYIGLAVSIGIKIVLLYCLISTGLGLGNGWLDEAQGIGTAPHPNMTAFDVMGAAVIFMMLCWQIPKLFAAVLGGSPALTAGDLVATGTAIVAGAATAASLAATAGAGVAAAAGVASGAGAASASGGGGAGGADSVASVGSAGSGAGGGGSPTVPPPSSPSGGTAPSSGPRQPNPPTNGSGGASQAAPSTRDTASFRAENGANGSNSDSRSEVSEGGSPPPSAVRSALARVGGDNLAGSGFEGQRRAAGFATSSTRVVQAPVQVTGAGVDRGGSGPGMVEPTSPTASAEHSGPGPVAEVSSVASVAGGQSQPPAPGQPSTTAQTAARVLSKTASRLKGARNRLSGWPSDAAPHAQPPRMPIEHND